MYCQTCLSVIQQLRNVFKADDEQLCLLHHQTAASLRNAAIAGCRFCCVFWNQYTGPEKQTILDYDQSESEPDADEPLPDLSDDSDDAWAVRKMMLKKSATFCMTQLAEYAFQRTPERFKGGICLAIVLNDERDLPSSGKRNDISIFLLEAIPASIVFSISQFKVPQNRYSILDVQSAARTSPSSNTGSQHSWVTAEIWIRDCAKTHPTCNVSSENTWLPSRLLDLSDMQKSGTVRVIETKAQDISGRYMTLSHRWGLANPYSLTRDTAQQLFAGVRFHSLPTAFQDAITICQRLQVTLLWIDSLCIMQDKDDLSDWIKEAALMQKVYSCSFLNISALAAADSNHSFFTDRNVDMISEGFIDTALEGLSIGRESKRYRVLDILFWESQLAHANLNLRAWVLQERLLAPRVLHFGCEQLLWECHEMDAAETYTDGLPEAMSIIAGTRFKTLDPEFQAERMRHVQQDDPPEMAPYRLWERIVGTYTKCGLTKAEDKLIALSGIAKYMSAMLQDEYIAGMWRRYLASELLWRVEDQSQSDYEPAKRSTQYRAPTFSWASVDGVITPGPPSEQDLLIEVVEVDIQYATGDRTGLVSGGSILLRCQLQRIEFMRNPAYNKNYVLKINGVEARPEKDKGWARRGPLIKLDEHESYFDPALADQNTLFCVPAHVWGDSEWLSVILLQLVNADQGQYRRFGLAMSNVPHDIEVMRRRPPEKLHLPVLSEEDDLAVIRLI